MLRILGTIAATILLVALRLVPQVAAAEHCAGARYVDDLEPSTPQNWHLDSIHVVSWLIAEGCGPLTYRVELSRNGSEFQLVGETGPHEFDGRVEFPWVVDGVVGDQVVFRVRRVLVDPQPPYSYTSSIEIQMAVQTQRSSWSAVRARY